MADDFNIGYQYKFDITFILLNDGNNIEFKALRLIGVDKICNYTTDFLPKLIIQCNVDERYLKLLHSNQDRIICNVRIYREVHSVSYYDIGRGQTLIRSDVESENNYVVLFEKGLPQIALKGTSYFNEETALKYQEMMKKEDKKGDPSTTSSTVMGSDVIQLTCTLFELDDRRLNKIIINDHIISATPADALGTIITLVSNSDKKQMKIGQIIDPPDNTIQYKEIWLLPLNLASSLRAIQRIYGVYKHGMILFLDNGLLYILKKYSTEHEYAKWQPPYTIINLAQKPGLADSYPFPVNINTKTGNVPSYRCNNRLKTNNKDMETSESVAEKMVFTNTNLMSSIIATKKGKPKKNSEGFQVLTKASKGHKETGTKMLYDYDELNNPYNIYEFFQDLSSHNVFNLTIRGASPNDFTPNKKIILKITDDEDKNETFGGDYCINSAIFSYRPIDKRNNSFDTIMTAFISISKGI